MTRAEKYKLERSLIELENITDDLERYSQIRAVFNEMMGKPMEQITSWFGVKHDESGQRD